MAARKREKESSRMVLDRKKTAKDVYDWLVEEAFEFHQGDGEVIKKLKKGTTTTSKSDDST